MLLTFALRAIGQPGDAPPCAECIVPILDPGQAVVLPPALGGLRVAIRTTPGGERAVMPVLRSIRDAGGAPALFVAGLPAQPLDPEAVGLAGTVFLDISGGRSDASPDDLAFTLKTRLTELRGASPGAALGLVFRPDQGTALRSRDVMPYLDVVAELIPGGAGRPAWPRDGDPYAVVEPAAEAAAAQRGKPRRWLWRAPADAVDAATLVRDLSRAGPLLVADLLPGGSAEVSCAGRRVPTFLHPRTLETIALVAGCAEPRVEKPAGAAPQRITLSHGDVLIRVPAAEGQFADDVRVVGARDLAVEEIVARHQAAVARQKSIVRTSIATGAMTLTFEAPGFPAPITIASDAIIYDGEGRTEIQQRSIRVNGIAFDGGRIPRLPIVEPERVASPPLAITLTDVYRYALDGRDRVGGTPCYVIEFTPVDPRRPLFRGRAWIAADTFAMLRVVAAQTGLRGPIVSSEQVDEFSRQADGVWLVARSEIRQIYEGPSHRTPIHRVLSVRTHEINPPDFAARRTAAYASDSVMLRDTPQGFRYLRRERTSETAATGEPVVAAASTRVRTLALGAILDPNISRPLPFAGLSYVDFDLFRTGTQLNAFFGGTYGQVAFSVPSLFGSRWQLAGNAFGIASSYNDRAFEAGREIYARNITQRPAHASVWALRAITPRLSMRAGYDLDYTQYGASELTAAGFTVPADQVAHSLRLALQGQRAGWSGSVWWAGTRRAGWRPWGTSAADYAAGQADYQRYGVTLARPFVISPSVVARVEAAWMAGHDLDRFSRYAFGTFDNRLRGYPSALIRYDRGGVVRTATAWGAGGRLRVDGFLDCAYVHDPGFGSGLGRYTGVGAAVEVPAPFGMLAAVEWGYGFEGVNSSGRRGTQVIRLSAFKIF